MKFTILCDEIPKKCNDCPFWQESLEKVEGEENRFNITRNCFLGSNSKCPLTEVNTIWSDSEK